MSLKVSTVNEILEHCLTWPGVDRVCVYVCVGLADSIIRQTLSCWKRWYKDCPFGTSQSISLCQLLNRLWRMWIDPVGIFVRNALIHLNSLWTAFKTGSQKAPLVLQGDSPRDWPPLCLHNHAVPPVQPKRGRIDLTGNPTCCLIPPPPGCTEKAPLSEIVHAGLDKPLCQGFRSGGTLW